MIWGTEAASAWARSDGNAQMDRAGGGDVVGAGTYWSEAVFGAVDVHGMLIERRPIKEEHLLARYPLQLNPQQDDAREAYQRALSEDGGDLGVFSGYYGEVSCNVGVVVG